MISLCQAVCLEDKKNFLPFWSQRRQVVTKKSAVNAQL